MSGVFCIGMFKNEADIIESFIRYHSHIFDGIVLLDNGSTDNSVPIVKKLQEEGLPVYLKIDSNFEYNQSEKTTELFYYTLNQFNPDFIFPLDMDEFLIAPGYPGNPRDIINNLENSDIIYYIPMLHYYPSASDDYYEVFIPKRIKNMWVWDNQAPKVVITNEIGKKYSPRIVMGNHDLAMSKTVMKKEVLQTLKLAHYQYRSLEQIKSKFLVGWLNNIARYNYVPGQGYHWKWYYDLIKEDLEIDIEKVDINVNKFIGSPESIVEAINLTFCEPINMRYTSKNEVNYLKNLLNYCETLAQEYAKLRKEKNFLDEL